MCGMLSNKQIKGKKFTKYCLLLCVKLHCYSRTGFQRKIICITYTAHYALVFIFSFSLDGKKFEATEKLIKICSLFQSILRSKKRRIVLESSEPNSWSL